jgi:hypothetical protein
MRTFLAQADVNKPSIETQENSAVPECPDSSRRVGMVTDVGEDDQ